MKRLCGTTTVALLFCSVAEARKTPVYKTTVDYRETLGAMIARGKYAAVDPDINDRNFRVGGSGGVVVRLELVVLGSALTADEALRELDRRGFRPARIEELLAFGAKYYKKQRGVILAFGSLWRDKWGSRNVVCLRSDGRGRRIETFWFGSTRSERDRFLVVRK